MKVSFITILLVLGIAVNSLEAQPLEVIKSLKQKFPTAKNIKWTKGYYNVWEAKFLLGGRKTSASFDNEGHWLHAQQEIDLEEIGVEEVKKSIKRDFSNCKILLIIIYNSPEFGTWYDVEGMCGTEKKRMGYDSNGWPMPKIT